MPENTKRCAHCGKQINADAPKCEHCGSMQQAAPASPRRPAGSPAPAGTILSGRYRIVRELGRGGMGVVYLARDQELSMDVATKLLPVELASNPDILNSLRAEARLSMSLTHPNIMRLHTLDTSGQLKFLVMEYVDGPTLQQMLRKKKKLKLDEVLPIIRAICRGLEHAHSKRVLHRDLKPANIMLNSKGEVKIMDFGIARQMKESMSELSQRIVAGTPLYMAPEHIMGRHLTMRSDIYSLGALAYELLAGFPPFYRGDIVSQIRFKDPSPISGIPKAVSDVILSALAKKPDSRPASATAFYKALTEATLQTRPAVSSTGKQAPPQPARPPAPRIPYKAPALAKTPPSPGKKRGPKPEYVLILALLAIAAVGYYIYYESNVRTELAELMQETDKALEESNSTVVTEATIQKLRALLEKCETFKKDYPYSFKLLTETVLDEKINDLQALIQKISVE